MAHVPEHYECDHCGVTALQEELKAVPADATRLTNDLCGKCRADLGWTDEKIDTVWDRIRAWVNAGAAALETEEP